MPCNVEIKAKIESLDLTMQAAEAICDGPPELIEQEDIFFHSINGRLKLRIISPTNGQLIFYQREDKDGPKTSTYNLLNTDNPSQMRILLTSALGEKIIVRKLRHLYLVGRTRIHIDIVENLGNFLELEVVLNENEAPLTGEKEAEKLMTMLGIKPKSLIEGAYADLLAGLT